MADITLVEGLFEMCEKHFGKTATKLILGLVLTTVIIGCLGFILGNFIIPTYHIIGMMIQDREHIVISRRQVFDVAINSIITGVLYLVLYWIATFPARRYALSIQRDNVKIRREIQETSTEFEGLKQDLHTLSELNYDLQSHCLQALNGYIRSLEYTSDGKALPPMADSRHLKQMCKSRDFLKEQLEESKKFLDRQAVLEPRFELMPPSSDQSKPTSQP